MEKLCSKCGNLVKENQKFCSNCGNNLENEKNKEILCVRCGKTLNSSQKYCDSCGAQVKVEHSSPIQEKPKQLTKKLNIEVIGALVAIGIVVVIIILIATGIENSSSSNDSSSYNTSNTYSSHTPSYTYENASTVLKFSNIRVTHNSSYTVCTGTVTNNGSKTYKFVEIKGSFENYSGTVVDTDWTYAVGNEGLAPGESATFRMSIPKDSSVRDCSISIIDYDT